MTFIAQTTLASSTPDLVLPNVQCEAAASVGDWVRMSSGIAIRASADNLEDSNVIGLLESKINATTCNIRVLGVSDPIFTGLDESKEYLLSISPGQMDITAPTDSGQIILKLGQPFDSQRFLVLKGNRIKRS